MIIVGRLFGLVELLYLGVGALVAVLLAAIAVRLSRARVEVAREVSPQRTHVGEQVHVSLEVHNRSAVPTSMLSLTDHIRGLPRAASFRSRPIPPGGRGSATYDLTCHSRGIYAVGPLTLTVSDPYGIARVSRTFELTQELAVYPPVISLSALPLSSGRDVATQASRPTSTPQGEDFYTLREYQVGDDLRKVHWRSTARRGQLMIKQEELPWHARGTVVLDTRRSALGSSGTPAFESTVVAAASAVQLFSRRRQLCRLVMTDGTDVGFGDSQDHFRTVLDQLAVVEETAVDRFSAALSALNQAILAGGALVFCGGLLSDDEVRRLTALGSRYSPMVAVRYPPWTATNELGGAREAEREAKVDAQLRSGRFLVVRPKPDADGLVDAWERVVGVARRSQVGRAPGEPTSAGRRQR